MPPIKNRNINPTSGRGTKKNTSKTPQNNSSKKRNQTRSNSGYASVNSRGMGGQNLGGFGAMQSAPVSMSRTSVAGRPQMQSARNGDCRIVHREYIQDIVGGATGTNFNNTAFAINPGQSSVFQWLSKIAQNFESYRFRRLKFDFETEASSSREGTLILAVDYDASDVAPTSKQQMLAFRGSVRSAPWTPCQHTSLGEDLNKLKSHFVRPAAVPANTDIKLYDVGILNVATQGLSANSLTIGELYVEYDVELLTPVFEQATVASFGTAQSAAGTIASPVGAAPTIAGSLISGMPLAVLGLQNMTIGAEYLITYGGTTDASTVAYGTLVGVTLKNTIIVDNITTSITVLATANVGSVTVTQGGVITNPLLVVAQINVGVL